MLKFAQTNPGDLKGTVFNDWLISTLIFKCYLTSMCSIQSICLKTDSRD